MYNMEKFLNRNILLFLLLISLILTVTTYIRNVKSNKDIEKYKQELLKKDELVSLGEGKYKVMVDDFNTQRDLTRILKEENNSLSNKLDSLKNKPVTYTVIKSRPQVKIDTVVVEHTDNGVLFEDYYPNKSDFFIKYSGKIKDSILTSKWNFSNLDLSLVISETRSGYFEEVLDAPEWLTIEDIKVNSIPLSNVKPDNFDWMVGGTFSKELGGERTVLGVEGGVRFKKNIYSLGINSDSYLTLSFKKLL